ncbi:DciA family protein [Streptomyces sp. H39-C1]|uniref:DciA family protein n=1 Tax=Streptomyces sp. H39-C1 TaxID=3004355 RepID=UPI0022AF5246|nr:DciA family protein [Streptomyces sp. H39-C1]MCZ4098011.1 DciA family protein [Streptomyces sp. H39-C1]
MPVPPAVAGEGDLVRRAMQHARQDARRRSFVAARSNVHAKPPRSGKRRPVLLRDAITELLARRGWHNTETMIVMGQWATLGEDLVAHLVPVGFDSATGTLQIRADSSAWMTQARLLAPSLVQWMNQALRADTVREIVIAGPPSRQQPAPAKAPATNRRHSVAPSSPHDPQPPLTGRQPAAPARPGSMARSEHNPPPTDPGDTEVLAAMRRQAAGTPREPEHLFARSLELQAHRSQNPRSEADDVRARALARACSEKALLS